MAGCTSEERAVLEQFRSRITDLSCTFNEFEQHDIFALSWLRARDMNIKKAEEMIRKCFEWRRINKIESMVTTWKPPSDYSTRYPYEICGYDTEHSPIVICPFGRWDVRKAADDGDAKVWLKYNQLLSLIVVEDVRRKIRETSKYISQFVVIIDFQGFTLRQLTSKACIEAHMESVRQYEDNYPETLKAAYIVNAPKIFTILFNIVKPLLSAHTLSKIQIYDSNSTKWKSILSNNIPVDQLPIHYGGTKKSKIAIDAGFGDLEEDEDLVERVIDAGAQLKLEFSVDIPRSTLIWKFKTESYDIGFSLKYTERDIVPYERVDAGKAIHEGTYLAEKTGKYTMVFDNTYSRLRSKNLMYIASVKTPNGNKYSL